MKAWFGFLQKCFPDMTIDEIQLMLAPLLAHIMPHQTDLLQKQRNSSKC